MQIIDKLAWLYIQDKRLLVARSQGKDTFYLPGGKRDPGESDHAALIREIKEELSVDLLPETIQYIGVFQGPAHGKAEEISLKITCYRAEYAGKIQPNAEIEEIQWIANQDEVKCSEVTQQVIKWLKSKSLI